VVDEKNVVGQNQTQNAPKSDDQVIAEMFNACGMQINRELKILFADLINFLVQRTKASQTPQVPPQKVVEKPVEPKVVDSK